MIWKYVVIYWLTTATSNLVLVQQYMEECKCVVEVPQPMTERTDTSRKVFNSKAAAIKFMGKLYFNYTDWRLDSFQVKKTIRP